MTVKHDSLYGFTCKECVLVWMYECLAVYHVDLSEKIYTCPGNYIIKVDKNLGNIVLPLIVLLHLHNTKPLY